MSFQQVMDWVSKIIDSAGVVVIVVGSIYATCVFAWSLVRRDSGILDPYRIYRETVGRSILLGLEFLIAGDIIRTVAVAPSFKNVGVLAILVMIRSFLSMELQVEIDGYWPWQRGKYLDQKTAMATGTRGPKEGSAGGSRRD